MQKLFVPNSKHKVIYTPKIFAMQKLHDYEDSERFTQYTLLANLQYIGNQYMLPILARMTSEISSVHRLGFHYANFTVHISCHERRSTCFQQQLHKIFQTEVAKMDTCQVPAVDNRISFRNSSTDYIAMSKIFLYTSRSFILSIITSSRIQLILYSSTEPLIVLC